MSNLKPIFQRYPWLIRPAAIGAMLIFPVVATVQFWMEDWPQIKREYRLYWNLLLYKRETK